MRESKTFAKRTKALKSDEPIKKFFLVCEGEKTEIIYFNSLQKFSYKLGINPSIEMIPIIRSYSETGWNNPKKIIDTLIKKLEENDLKKYQKNSYDGDTLVLNIDTAIKNEKNFCEKVEELKNSVGCNIGLLIEKMREKNT